MKTIPIKCRNILSIALILFMMSPAISSIAADTNNDDESLKDLTGVYIRIALGDEIINRGLSVEQIEAEYKPMVESAGIKILSLSELRDTPGSPILIIGAESFKNKSLSSDKKTLYSFVASVSLYQLVDTDKKGVPIGKSVWNIQDRGITYNLKDIRLYIKRLLNTFIRSYRPANP